MEDAIRDLPRFSPLTPFIKYKAQLQSSFNIEKPYVYVHPKTDQVFLVWNVFESSWTIPLSRDENSLEGNTSSIEFWKCNMWNAGLCYIHIFSWKLKLKKKWISLKL